MKLYTYQKDNDGVDRIGVGCNTYPDKLWPIEVFDLSFADMNDLICNITPAQLSKMSRGVMECRETAIALESVRLRAPIPHPKQDVLCMGINYADHAIESARFHEEAFLANREKAIYFSKRTHEATGCGDPIPAYEGLVDSLDYEAELGVIIGKDCKNVRAAEAAQYIFGYTIINDVSARNLQTAHKQWYFGKSLDGFTPMGPCILTADEVAFPPALGISSTVNGEVRQNSNTDHLIHTVAEIIEELTQGMTLCAGTIIATGTPAGVGMGFTPPRFLKKGDVITCEIEGIGVLKNTVE